MRRSLLLIVLATLLLAFTLSAVPQRARSPKSGIPRAYTQAFKPLKGHRRPPVRLRQVFERERAADEEPPPPEGEPPEVPPERWHAFNTFLAGLLPGFDAFRKASEARRARMAAIAQITQKLPESIVYEPPYAAAMADPEGNEDLLIGAMSALADESGVVQAGVLIPFAHSNPIYGSAYSRVAIEVDAWRPGRLRVLAIIPELVYSAQWTAGQQESAVASIARLKLEGYVSRTTPGGEESSTSGEHIVVENPTDPVVNSQVSKNLIFPSPNSPMQVGAGDHLTILFGLTATGQAYEGASASAAGFGTVTKIHVSIVQD